MYKGTTPFVNGKQIFKKCSQKIGDFQKPRVLRLLTEVIWLQTSLGIAWPPQLSLNITIKLFVSGLMGGERFQEWKDFTVMTWSKCENKIPALEVMRSTITTINSKKEKWGGGGSWEVEFPNFTCYIGLCLNVIWLQKQGNVLWLTPLQRHFDMNKMIVLNRDKYLNIGYCVSLEMV